MSDVDDDIDASKAPLLDHLIELRSRLIKAMAAFVVMMILCFAFAKHIYQLLVWPYVLAAGGPGTGITCDVAQEYMRSVPR